VRSGTGVGAVDRSSSKFLGASVLLGTASAGIGVARAAFRGGDHLVEGQIEHRRRPVPNRAAAAL
jgi:hypothetical protein